MNYIYYKLNFKILHVFFILIQVFPNTWTSNKRKEGSSSLRNLRIHIGFMFEGISKLMN